MHSFTDADGRAWEVSIDIPLAKVVWQRTQINLRAREHLARLTGDESLWLIPDVLYVICESQAAKRYEKLAGDVAALSAEFGRLIERCMPAACEALFGELADFCQRLGLQATARLVEALSKQLATREAAEDQRLGAKMLPAMEAEMETELARRDQVLARILGTNVGKPPEPSDSAASRE
jgi:hypothetical protein